MRRTWAFATLPLFTMRSRPELPPMSDFFRLWESRFSIRRLKVHNTVYAKAFSSHTTLKIALPRFYVLELSLPAKAGP